MFLTTESNENDSAYLWINVSFGRYISNSFPRKDLFVEPACAERGI